MKKMHLNFRLLARHSFVMRSTFSLHLLMAVCSSFVTSNPKSCFGEGFGAGFAACFMNCFVACFAFSVSMCLEVSTCFTLGLTLVTFFFFDMMRVR